jgi:ribonuclease PH
VSATRPAGRDPDQLRDTSFELGAAPFAEGSCLISMGGTRVLCTASVEPGVPPFREGIGGWLTGEYAMLPRATLRRTSRERRGPRGRTQEIQRLIGRSLRAAVDLAALGDRTVTVDCDVLAADGGTRTASITGGCLAVADALRSLLAGGELETDPLRQLVAAISVGIVDGRLLLDLEYTEDVTADVDFNVVALEDGRIVEVQGTAEGAPFSRRDLHALLDLAESGIRDLLALQREALGAAP